jgi:hypothetical protein
VNQTSLGLLSTSTYGAIARFLAAYPQHTHMASGGAMIGEPSRRRGEVPDEPLARRMPVMIDQRIEWLANLCQLEPVLIRVIRVLAERDAFVPLGELVDRLRISAVDAALLSRSQLRDWGLVRVANEPEPAPALKLNERIWRFLHADPSAAEEKAIALCRIQVVRREARNDGHLSAETDATRGS